MKIILPLLFGLLGASSLSAQTIAFAIPNTASNEWSGGVAILFMDFNSFFLSDDQTTVDFTTQTAFTGDTNPLGNEVGIRTTPPAAGAAAIYISGDSCVILGLDRVILHDYGIRIGGNTLAERNVIATLTADGALPAESLTFAYSLVRTGAGPCPSALGGLCLDILSPVTVAGNAIANGSGIAALTIQVPALAPLIDVHMQVVIPRGLGGANSIKSNTVTATIQ